MVKKPLMRTCSIDECEEINEPTALDKLNSPYVPSTSSPSSSTTTTDDILPWNESREAKEQLFTMFSCAYALVSVVVGVLVEMSRILNVDPNEDAKTEGLSDLVFSIYMYGGSLVFLFYFYAVLLKAQFDIWKLSNHPRSKLSTLVQAVHTMFRARIVMPPKQTASADSVDEPLPPATGGLFLRIGCVVFGLFGVVYCGLVSVLCMFEFTSTNGSCTFYTFGSAGLSMLFIFIQMHFVFCNSSITISHSFNIARFGMMHLVATNLWTWLRYIIIEEHVTTMELQRANFSLGEESLHKKFTKYINNSSAIEEIEDCEGVQCIFGSFTEFMYTCLVEYALICATISFVFWTKIGKGISAYHRKRQKMYNMIKIDCSNSTTGLFLGFVVIAATFICITVFNSFVTQNPLKDTAFMIFYLTKTGFLCICFVAIIVAFKRMRKLSYKEDEEDIDESAELLDRILLVFGLTGELIFSIGGTMSLAKADQFHRLIILLLITKTLSLIQVLAQSSLILIGSKLKASNNSVKKDKPGKQVITFLLVANVALLILNTYEAQSAGIDEDIVRLYGSRSWAFVVRACAPLTIFFRFHSAACFADIWKHSYSSVKGEFDMH